METISAGGGSPLLEAENPFSMERFLAGRIKADLLHAVMDVFEGYELDKGSALACMDMLLRHIDFKAYGDVACFLLKGWVADHTSLIEDWLDELRKERGGKG